MPVAVDSASVEPTPEAWTWWDKLAPEQRRPAFRLMKWQLRHALLGRVDGAPVGYIDVGGMPHTIAGRTMSATRHERRATYRHAKALLRMVFGLTAPTAAAADAQQRVRDAYLDAILRDTSDIGDAPAGDERTATADAGRADAGDAPPRTPAVDQRSIGTRKGAGRLR